MTRFTKAYESLKTRLKWLLNRSLYSFNSALSHQSVVKRYLSGSGIEIGALHNPLQVPASVNVRYVDRMSTANLRKHYPELANKNLVDVSILDDGEQLKSIENETQDFVIAHQFLEHCQDPITAISNMLRVLKQNGILYLSIPDKRYTFDAARPTTTIEHLLKDYEEGPKRSREEHFREWVTFVNLGYSHPNQAKDSLQIETEMNRLMALNYSIHYHAWTQSEMLELVLACKKKLNFTFEIELFLKNSDEAILVLRKQ
ncbi:class I SAM-dependent methyltransferase [Kovacikia minuta CCNUW1]|uniref:class I SAM-dependent methyltransferase n=1 Tax=Kovacikia minuta TaxID=2931930 RepID=UPI001CC9FDF1|nr:methyltransferase domain-containing protein [Kovacikia minuta]UBF26014.1 class I SAM-dependent methyltransferase [Kovacikia minuta CCNUW1]